MFRYVSVAFGGYMEDFRDAKPADFLYVVVNVFVPLQHRMCGTVCN